MKITLRRISPNYRQKFNTLQIMDELTVALLVLVVYSIAYHFSKGSVYGIHALMIYVISILTALVTECAWAKFVKKEENLFSAVRYSFPLVTAIIFALTLPVGTPYYVVGVGSFIAVFFGKLIYGGFGSNIFNPALVGRVVVHLSFGAQLTSVIEGYDAIAGATPLTAWASTNFMGETGTSLLSLFTGGYSAALGETCTLLILILGVALAYRQVLDYRISVSYLGTVFVLGFIQGLVCGLNPFTTALAHIAIGGVAFGAVFMATDPVTSPTSPLGKIIYGVALGFITMLIRLKANFPEGVLFSILMMNMFTPMLDSFTAFRTNKNVGKQYGILAGLLVAASVCIGALSTGLELPEVKEDTPEVEPAGPSYTFIEKSGNTYTMESTGFSGSMKVAVTIDADGKATIELLDTSGETDGFGQDLIKYGSGETLNLAAKEFKEKVIDGAVSEEEINGIDLATGATKTATGIANAIKGAFEVKKNSPVVVNVDGNTYTVESKGFNGSKLVVDVTIEDGAATVAIVDASGETDGFGQDLIKYGSGETLKASAKEFKALVLDAAVTPETLVGVDTATGATFTASGIVNAITEAFIEAGVKMPKPLPASIKSVDGNKYTVESKGFGGAIVVEVTIEDGAATIAIVEANGETDGFGKDLINVGSGETLKPAAKAFYDTVINGSVTQDQLAGVDLATGATLTATGIANAINDAFTAAGGQ